MIKLIQVVAAISCGPLGILLLLFFWHQDETRERLTKLQESVDARD